MRWISILCLCAVLCIRFATTAAKWDDTVAPLIVVEPAASADNVTYNFHMAHFGAVPYGQELPAMRLVHIDHTCMCGDVPCYTGCGDFSLTTDDCMPDVSTSTELGNGALIMIEETGGDVDDGCLRSERAYNTAIIGAQGVMIVPPHGTNDSSLVTAPAVNSHSATAAYETLLLQHVNIPVGLMTYNHAHALKKIVNSTTSDVRVSVDFTQIFTASTNVTIYVWHNTGDDCGPPCFYLHEFLTELNDVAKLLVPGHPITLVPRFTYDSCSPASDPLCEVSCTNQGRYCHKKIENTHLWGRVVAEENIRQACLYNVLRTQSGSESGSGDTRAFWEYKKWYQANCTNNKRTFNHICSESAFNETMEGGELFTSWKQCWSNVGDVDVDLPIAQRDVDGMVSQEVSEGLLATVVINDQHYRGALDAGHVMKAACSTLTDSVVSGLEVCERYTLGHCAPGSEGDRVCGSSQNAEINKTICLETEDGYECDCTAGYAAIDREGEVVCLDRNECLEFETLCERNEDTRNTCQNTEGSFECFFDAENYCTSEKDFGGCWTQEIRGVTVTSCEDMFHQYSANLENGREGGDLHRCNCENIYGCFAGGEENCVQQCIPAGTCNPSTQECTARPPPPPISLIAGLSGAAAVVVLVAAVVGFLVYRRKQKKNADVQPGQVSDYANFRDGMDADEMERNGATDVKPGAPAPVISGGAVSAVSASQYAMQAGNDPNLHASLQLEEQSSLQLES